MTVWDTGTASFANNWYPNCVSSTNRSEWWAADLAASALAGQVWAAADDAGNGSDATFKRNSYQAVIGARLHFKERLSRNPKRQTVVEMVSRRHKPVGQQPIRPCDGQKLAMT